MSIATWHVVFVHPEENFKAPRSLYETAKKALERLASPGYECNEDGSSSAYFRPNEPDRPINQRDGGRASHVPFHYCVRHFVEPTPEEQYDAQRYCRACGALVTTLVTCSECGTEEDPTEWKIGPPLTLYRRTFEVAFEFNGGPDLCRASDEIIEAKLRAELQGVLEELEGVAGTAFVMKKYAGP